MLAWFTDGLNFPLDNSAATITEWYFSSVKTFSRGRPIVHHDVRRMLYGSISFRLFEIRELALLHVTFSSSFSSSSSFES
eukprot:jgi/Botrbrau1/760/Bobra.0181s0019.1